jgi:predicted transcriptional regulator
MKAIEKTIYIMLQVQRGPITVNRLARQLRCHRISVVRIVKCIQAAGVVVLFSNEEKRNGNES